MPTRLRSQRPAVWTFLLTLVMASQAFVKESAAQAPLSLNEGEKVVFIGNTLAERLQEFNNFETALHSRFPTHRLVVRNLGWSADTINMRLRSNGFEDHGHQLTDHQPDVILAFFGFNESFNGPEGLPKFKADLSQFLHGLRELKYPVSTLARGSREIRLADKPGTVSQTPRIVLSSPIANEDLPAKGILAGEQNNKNIALYTQAMREVCAQEKVPFIDLYTPTKRLMDETADPLTINGCHLNEQGDAAVSRILMQELFGPNAADNPSVPAALTGAIAEKNRCFYDDYRATNGCYIYGERKRPFGVVNFPPEFEKLKKMATVRDQRIWDAAQGKPLSPVIDDSKTGELPVIETNFKNQVKITTPEESAKMFVTADGFDVQLWASEVEFPDLMNPVAFAFDNQGRMWLTTMPSYPMPEPGVPVDDKVIILADTDGDHRADQQTVFATGLAQPTGIELGDGGAYIANQPNLLFLRDVDGDDKADIRETRLHGFDTADSHHAISAFQWGPGGDLFMLEGTFLHTQVETPSGPRRCTNGAVYRYEPRPEKLDVYVAYNFANPWGHSIDAWGQGFLADASGGANYITTAFSGDLDFPRQHRSLKQFLTKQWRPNAGSELVSSRHFPEEMQGDYLLTNCIGFQGILQYRVREAGSGFEASPVSPLLRSEDPNFRPVAVQFGPDGALYVLDWFNPLIGHMQHSIRDPLRDHHHGRIWRVTHRDRPLVEPPVIAGASLTSLLEQLKSPEDRTRYRVRRELRDRPTADVLAAVDQWTAGLDPKDPASEHCLLEALWVKQHHDVVDLPLLNRLLTANDGRARAAAVRVLCCWRDRVPDALSHLRTAVNDPHPRVRLEAVRALSFYDNQAALEVAVESLLEEQDPYLEYTLNETLETLEGRLRNAEPARP